MIESKDMELEPRIRGKRVGCIVSQIGIVRQHWDLGFIGRPELDER